MANAKTQIPRSARDDKALDFAGNQKGRPRAAFLINQSPYDGTACPCCGAAAAVAAAASFRIRW